ncbi:hypothetical protein FD754_023298, partial [Muntiacus muntjak]
EQAGAQVQARLQPGEQLGSSPSCSSELPPCTGHILSMSVSALFLFWLYFYFIPARLLCPRDSPDKNTRVVYPNVTSSFVFKSFVHKSLCNFLLSGTVECHPYLNQSKLLEFCKSHDIVLVAYAALGSQLLSEWVNSNNPVLLEDPVLCAIAKKHKQTPALVALRYQIQRGVVVLAKSFNKKRIKENMQVFDFELTPEDMKAIDGLNRNIRYYDFQQHHPFHPNRSLSSLLRHISSSL